MQIKVSFQFFYMFQVIPGFLIPALYPPPAVQRGEYPLFKYFSNPINCLLVGFEG